MKIACTAVLLLLAGPLAAGEARHSIYSPDFALLAEGTPGAVEQEYVWFAGRPVAQFDGGAVRYTFADHLGTPLLQTGADGAVAWRAEHEPYGEVHALRAGAGLRQPLRLPGQESDETTGARAYNVNRWYRPSWGRYTQADPLGLEGGPHLYGYSLDNPVAFTDPDGLRVRMCCRPIIAGGRHCFFQFEGSEDNRPVGFHGPENVVDYVRGWFGAKTGQVKTDAALDRGRADDDRCGPWAGGPCLDPDRCVRSEAAAYPSPSQYGGMLTGPNSNTFAFHVARQCGITPPVDVWAPGKDARVPGR